MSFILISSGLSAVRAYARMFACSAGVAATLLCRFAASARRHESGTPESADKAL
jgi:hypothetical protein